MNVIHKVGIMHKDTIDWLLKGPAWLKYAVELQLLDSQPDIQPVLEDAAIREIIGRLKDKRRGIPAITTGCMNADEYENPYWDLFFLADIGLTAADAGLQKEIEEYLESQSARGTYITEYGMEPTYFCKSVILLSSIARMGYLSDPHIQKLVQLLLPLQRLDGGWYCNPNHNIGAPLQHEVSCPQDNLNVLLLLGQYAEYRHNTRFKGAIDLLLKHWELRGTGVQIVYFGVGRRYQSLRYPATRYGILRVLDALSLFSYSKPKASFHSMLDFVHSKAVSGKYRVEMPSSYTDLEAGNGSSRLLTFIINRIDKRIANQ
jgi:hypothetical protein